MILSHWIVQNSWSTTTESRSVGPWDVLEVLTPSATRVCLNELLDLAIARFQGDFHR